ncbi:glycoside hydrolase family 172 protein [Promicromonospora sp. MS192]|uniref:glycoside hydrolase family 172 protein n=1 Tax=Promicromonospora sp. MS192 TaxID=3412684 RepID=UPI003C2FF88A
MTYLWNRPSTKLVSRSINAENPDGRPGAAAAAASPLGPGRKGSAFLPMDTGQALTLADIEGPGVIRHLWITVPDRTADGPFVLRNLVLRAYWDGAPTPSVEVPLGDFFCNGFGERALVTSDQIVVAPTGGMNSYIQMPFRRGARITLENQHHGPIPHVFYQVDYTLGDKIDDDAPYFHAQWRRSNGTTAPGEDHVILDGIQGRGTYLGTFVALASLHRYWWGEGEVKFYIDDDTDLPTLCSTGLEDYAGGAWAFQDELRSAPDPEVITFSAPYCGYPQYVRRDTSIASPFVQDAPPMHGLYRWHVPDPIYFDTSLRVTLQQIGAWDRGLFERSDDVATVAYWYQHGTTDGFPPLPPAHARAPR